MAEPAELVLTGERTLPGIPEENYWFCRHLFAYELAAGLGATRVLDAGCGEGYGTALLADVGGSQRTYVRCEPPTSAVGVERDPVTVAHAAGRYPGVRFVRGDCRALPFPDATFDAVVTLQVIEHLPDPGGFTGECARVLAPGGTFLCATPNRLTFTPPGRPQNPFHVTEFAAAELAALLRCHFPSVHMQGVTDDTPGLADVLVESALAGEWPPPWAREAVAATTTASFSLTPALDAALDLLAWCTR